MVLANVGIWVGPSVLARSPLLALSIVLTRSELQRWKVGLTCLRRFIGLFDSCFPCGRTPGVLRTVLDAHGGGPAADALEVPRQTSTLGPRSLQPLAGSVGVELRSSICGSTVTLLGGALRAAPSKALL